ncbi:MAG: uncharacterized protein A8A55_2039 [Amphiamblys sp. WSBS2006]|nr:MAG: uncharacterized protein A8A55_2039 [Amphiamblys sp. WSBS2006]
MEEPRKSETQNSKTPKRIKQTQKSVFSETKKILGDITNTEGSKELLEKNRGQLSEEEIEYAPPERVYTEESLDDKEEFIPDIIALLQPKTSVSPAASAAKKMGDVEYRDHLAALLDEEDCWVSDNLFF